MSDMSVGSALCNVLFLSVYLPYGCDLAAIDQ